MKWNGLPIVLCFLMVDKAVSLGEQDISNLNSKAEDYFKICKGWEVEKLEQFNQKLFKIVPVKEYTDYGGINHGNYIVYFENSPLTPKHTTMYSYLAMSAHGKVGEFDWTLNHVGPMANTELECKTNAGLYIDHTNYFAFQESWIFQPIPGRFSPDKLDMQHEGYKPVLVKEWLIEAGSEGEHVMQGRRDLKGTLSYTLLYRQKGASDVVVAMGDQTFIQNFLKIKRPLLLTTWIHEFENSFQGALEELCANVMKVVPNQIPKFTLLKYRRYGSSSMLFAVFEATKNLESGEGNTTVLLCVNMATGSRRTTIKNSTVCNNDTDEVEQLILEYLNFDEEMRPTEDTALQFRIRKQIQNLGVIKHMKHSHVQKIVESWSTNTNKFWIVSCVNSDGLSDGYFWLALIPKFKSKQYRIETNQKSLSRFKRGAVKAATEYASKRDVPTVGSITEISSAERSAFESFAEQIRKTMQNEHTDNYVLPKEATLELAEVYDVVDKYKKWGAIWILYAKPHTLFTFAIIEDNDMAERRHLVKVGPVPTNYSDLCDVLDKHLQEPLPFSKSGIVGETNVFLCSFAVALVDARNVIKWRKPYFEYQNHIENTYYYFTRNIIVVTYISINDTRDPSQRSAVFIVLLQRSNNGSERAELVYVSRVTTQENLNFEIANYTNAFQVGDLEDWTLNDKVLEKNITYNLYTALGPMQIGQNSKPDSVVPSAVGDIIIPETKTSVVDILRQNLELVKIRTISRDTLQKLAVLRNKNSSDKYFVAFTLETRAQIIHIEKGNDEHDLEEEIKLFLSNLFSFKANSTINLSSYLYEKVIEKSKVLLSWIHGSRDMTLVETGNGQLTGGGRGQVCLTWRISKFRVTVVIEPARDMLNVIYITPRYSEGNTQLFQLVKTYMNSSDKLRSIEDFMPLDKICEESRKLIQKLAPEVLTSINTNAENIVYSGIKEIELKRLSSDGSKARIVIIYQVERSTGEKSYVFAASLQYIKEVRLFFASTPYDSVDLAKVMLQKYIQIGFELSWEADIEPTSSKYSTVNSIVRSLVPWRSMANTVHLLENLSFPEKGKIQSLKRFLLFKTESEAKVGRVLAIVSPMLKLIHLSRIIEVEEAWNTILNYARYPPTEFENWTPKVLLNPATVIQIEAAVEQYNSKHEIKIFGEILEARNNAGVEEAGKSVRFKKENDGVVQVTFKAKLVNKITELTVDLVSPV